MAVLVGLTAVSGEVLAQVPGMSGGLLQASGRIAALDLEGGAIRIDVSGQEGKDLPYQRRC